MINVTKTDLPPMEDYIQYLGQIWSSKWVTNDGELVKLLERRLMDYLNVKNLLLVSNGTSALQIALKSFKINGEVITTPFTFAATTNSILWENLTPVFADIDPETYNIDPSDVEKKITKKTSAIIAVHVYGNPCYVDELQEIATNNGLTLIYDSAHAFGVKYNNKSVLNFGDLSTLSFHATKTFNTAEGGAIVVKDDVIYEKIKLMRNHGIQSEERVVLPGINSKMNEFQAALGLCNLEYVKDKIDQRKKIYECYKNKLEILNEIKFQKITASCYNYAYMPVCFKDVETRDNIHSELTKNNINTRKYFFPLITDFDYIKKEDFGLEIASNISSRILCLPLYPDLKIGQVKKITDIIIDNDQM
ncbi:DegT/DnrJ/EryC1/StrS family aminotransferase [Methanobacterium sp.]|uniref:DegT/DnrJ/EryC1/StrS family aminotransferase n=1 Tax=Methanobacterium sp. TaxID=2164 RepID=UPI002AB86C05|nr:DegT/DnrJ/EryC1/StrS family aminotransferase [Methanobacterium sp.]MDY9922731.1 DegT/DnrJ/EryC1/StrS family aminotransferase [Methanobacterium sp.]